VPDPIQDFSKIPPLAEGLGTVSSSKEVAAANGAVANGAGKVREEAIEARLSILLSLIEERVKALEVKNADTPRAMPVRLGAGTLVTLAGTFLGVAALITLSSFAVMLQIDRAERGIGRIDERYAERLATLERQVSELPGTLMQGMRDMKGAITDAISAARQPPQVVVLPPAVQAPPTPARTPVPAPTAQPPREPRP
jgi:hypothetical protein